MVTAGINAPRPVKNGFLSTMEKFLRDLKKCPVENTRTGITITAKMAVDMEAMRNMVEAAKGTGSTKCSIEG
jgi:hypothetical protein